MSLFQTMRIRMKDCFGFDWRLGLAFGLNDGEWPKELTSGVMFYDGLRITRKMFNKYAKALDSE